MYSFHPSGWSFNPYCCHVSEICFILLKSSISWSDHVTIISIHFALDMWMVFNLGTIMNKATMSKSLLWAYFFLYKVHFKFSILFFNMTYLVAQMVKRLSTIQETGVRSLGREDPLEKEMAIYSSTIAWKLPWTEEPGRLRSMGTQRVRHDWATSLFFNIHLFCEWMLHSSWQNLLKCLKMYSNVTKDWSASLSLIVSS